MIRRAVRLLPLPVLTLASLVAIVAACSSETIYKTVPGPAVTPDEDAGIEEPDAAPEVDAAPPKPKPGITFPNVLSRGGPTIKAPKVVPITFSGDAMIPSITSFTQKIAASSYWSTLGAEYGVGAITVKPTVTLTEAAPTTTTFNDIDTWLAGKLSGTSPELGAPDESTLYAIFYPASTVIQDAGDGLGQSCQGYGGYHYETTANGKKVGYAVLPRCAGIDDLTIATSHEYYEWATDPFPLTTPAYNKLDDDHWAWGVVMLGELGDLCTFLDQENLRPTEIGFQVQRMWSNKASVAGKYPCAPAKTAPYFQAITLTPDEAIVPDLQDQTKTLTTKAVKVPPGKSVSADVVIYSDQSGTPQVPLRALSYADFFGGGQPSGITYKLSKDYAKPGETIQVEVTATAGAADDILVMTAYTGEQSAHYWPVYISVGTPGLQAPKPAASTTMAKFRQLQQMQRAGLRTTKLGLPTAPRTFTPAR